MAPRKRSGASSTATPSTKTKAKAQRKPAAKAKAQRKPAAKAKAQRSPKAPAPAAPPGTQAAIPGLASDPVEATTHSATQALARQAEELANAGRHVPHHLAQALRQAWLTDLDQYVWPSSTAAAADLGVTAATLRNWSKAGCPAPKHQPIPKAPVFRWLLERERAKATATPGAKDQIDDLELRLKAAKVEKLEGTLVAEAEDRARAALLATVTALRERLLHTLPTTLAEQLPGMAATDIEDHIRHAIEQQLAAASDLAPTTTEDPQP